MCDCLKSTGKIITEVRDIKDFDKVRVTDNINLFITQDSLFEVKVEAGKNLIDLLETKVVAGELQIKNKNRCNFVRDYKKPMNVYVTMPVVRYISNDGYGTVRGLNIITTPEFDIQTSASGDIYLDINNKKVISHMFGSGDVYLKGNSAEHHCHIVGNGFVNCSGLNTSYTWLYTRTTGNCYVNCSNFMEVIIDYTGNVYYKGAPKIEAKIKGEGKLYAQ